MDRLKVIIGLVLLIEAILLMFYGGAGWITVLLLFAAIILIFG